MKPDRLLILGDDSDLSGAEEWHELLSAFSVSKVALLNDACAAIQGQQTDCVLVTGVPAGTELMDILETIQAFEPLMPVLFRQPAMQASTTVRLIRAGAHHCFDAHNRIADIHEALDLAICKRRSRERACKATASNDEPWREHLVGDSRAMEAVAETIRLVGRRRCTVLISGETGTGKEMAARALHGASPRSQQPLVAINCSALPEHLLEAELFGHTKGAFTGAVNHRVGRFEQANKGTIFLDEIGDMPLDLQAKLLRVLQDREIQRLGSSESIKVDVRVLAATNVDLQERIAQGKFREDLYYRLNVVPLQMPPLRKRTSDIPMLVSHFIRKICAIEGIPLKRLTPETLDKLCSNPWRGNVRQLENAVEMAIAVSGDRDVLYPKDFGLAASGLRAVTAELTSHIPAMLPEVVDFETAVSRFEIGLLDNALRQSEGNKTVAAERLGIKRTTLIMKMRSFEKSGLLMQKAG